MDREIPTYHPINLSPLVESNLTKKGVDRERPTIVEWTIEYTIINLFTSLWCSSTSTLIKSANYQLLSASFHERFANL